MDQLTIDQRNKISWIRNLLKQNAPSVYKDFAAKKIQEHEESNPWVEVKKIFSPEINTKKEEEYDFIKDMEEEKLKYADV